MIWFKTRGPLNDGWYWWKCRDDDPEPECLHIYNGMIIDKRTSGDFGEICEVYEHQDYSGFWYGPISCPSMKDEIKEKFINLQNIRCADCGGRKDPISGDILHSESCKI